MKRTDDFSRWIEKQDCDEARKTVATQYVSSLRPLENGGAADIKAISAALIAQAPMLLEIYFRQHVTKSEVETAVAIHATECRAVERRDGSTPINWRRLGFSTVSRIGWPAAVIYFLSTYREVVTRLLGG